jgi:hypothetical protein
MKGCKRGIPRNVSDPFVAEICHELGNVLNGLLGMAQLVRDSALTAEQDRWLRAIEQSGWQLRRLVDAFRQGPVRAGDGATYRPATLDGVDLMEQLLLAHAPAARAQANRLWLTADSELPRCWVSDVRLLRQLLDNLLGNALKFTRSGEVELEARMATADAGSHGSLMLAVTDSGPGIHPELGQRMFEAYERGPAPVRDECGGYGLGLFICQRIVRTLGGDIRWSTPSTGGTRFTVTLPGVISSAPSRPAIRPSRILQSVECRVELQGAARRSVVCSLSRLGVARGGMANRPEGAVGRAIGGPDHFHGPAPVLVSIQETPIEAGASCAPLLLQTRTPDGGVLGSRLLDTPVLECSLGPLLLELALECLWLRNADRG